MMLLMCVELFAADEEYAVPKYTAKPTIFNRLPEILILDIDFGKFLVIDLQSEPPGLNVVTLRL